LSKAFRALQILTSVFLFDSFFLRYGSANAYTLHRKIALFEAKHMSKKFDIEEFEKEAQLWQKNVVTYKPPKVQN